MSDIAFAFSVVDAEAAEKLALAAEDAKLKVLRAPLTSETIGQASAVVAVWSATSVHSAIVNDVARKAADAGKLVSVRVGPTDVAEIYTADGLFDIMNWNGVAPLAEVDALIAALRRLVSGRKAAAAIHDAAPKAVRTLSVSTAGHISGANLSQGGIIVRSPPAQKSVSSARAEPIRAPERAGPVSDAQPAAKPAAAPPSPPKGPSNEPILFEPAQDYLAREAAFWVGIRNSGMAADYLRYLESFGEEGVFAELARFRLRMLYAGQEADSSPKKKRPERRRAKSGGVSRIGFGAIGVSVLAAAAAFQFARAPLGDVTNGLIGTAEAHVANLSRTALIAEKASEQASFSISTAGPIIGGATASSEPATPEPQGEPLRAAPLEALAEAAPATPQPSVAYAPPKPAPAASTTPRRRAYTTSIDVAAVRPTLAAVDLPAADEARPAPAVRAVAKLEQILGQNIVGAPLVSVDHLPDLGLLPIPSLPTELEESENTLAPVAS